MLVVARQEKLLEKLNLDGLTHWSPGNAVAVRELVLAYHDVFILEGNELGCTSAIKHEICIKNSEPFKEQYWHIPPPLLEEVHASLQDMLEVGVICPSQSPWCNVVVVVRKKDSTLHFCVNFRCLITWTKKDSYPLPCIQHTSHRWISSRASGRSRWHQSHSNTQPSQWVTSGSMSSPACCLGCVMPLRPFSISCKIPWAS